MANTTTLDTRIDELTFTIDQIANGSRGLLEEVATGKITGEEEYWSRTDLWDFQANVDGARVAFEGVQPILETKDPELAETLTTEFADLQALLDAQRVGDGFKYYDELSQEEINELADAVNALSEPLSRLTAAVLHDRAGHAPRPDRGHRPRRRFGRGGVRRVASDRRRPRAGLADRSLL